MPNSPPRFSEKPLRSSRASAVPDRIRLHADEQIARSVVRGLRARGVDISTTPETRLRGSEDPAQLAHAFGNGRVLLTQDADFLRMHAAGQQHAGIIYAAQGKSIGAMIRGTMLIVDLLDAESMAQHVEYI